LLMAHRLLPRWIALSAVLTSLSISDRLSVNAPGYVVAWTGADGLRTLPGIVGRIAAIS